MASHQDWEKKVCQQHDDNKPFSPENGIPLKFSVGDNVTYTNDYGVTFDRVVTGFYQREEGLDSLYAVGYRYYLNKDSYWMPVKESSLSPRFDLGPQVVGL